MVPLFLSEAFRVKDQVLKLKMPKMLLVPKSTREVF